jgi:putative transposase
MNAPLDPLYRRHRFPAEVIGYAIWLYFRFPLSLRMVEEMLAARGIDVSHESVRHWAEKFGREYSNRIRRRAPARGSKASCSTFWSRADETGLQHSGSCERFSGNRPKRPA